MPSFLLPSHISLLFREKPNNESASVAVRYLWTCHSRAAAVTGGFMSSSVAAGYTLAAGPVRADVIHTDTEGLDAGEAKVNVCGRA